MKKKLLEEFKKIFGEDGDIRCYFAPGRVNLIGEHTDYNGGHVFPCALTIGTYAAARKNNDKTLRFYSINFEKLGIMESTIDELEYSKADGWTNYVKAVIWTLRKNGYNVDTGMDIMFYGTIPNSSGLSSSASIEILTGYVLKDLFGFDFDMIKNALMGQEAENKYIGVNCGIMDQFAIAMGKKDNAIFLNTADLSYEYAPIKLNGCKIVIMNTNKKRGLGDSKYNERRSECELALEEVNKVRKVESWGSLSEEEFEELKYAIADDNRRKRAKHAVYENQRTIKAVKALRDNDIEELGRLMIASHESLRDDYEVTGIELDTLVHLALKQQGVYGARMTGAGFGGCAVSIVKDENVDEFIKNVGEGYQLLIGFAADFYVVEVGGGPVAL